MEPVPPLSIAGRIIAEFEDDAAAPSPAAAPAYVPPSEEAAPAAKRFWVEIIRRHTEEVPGHAGRLRVSGAAAPNRGAIVVEHIRADDGPAPTLRQGCELDTADAFCLTLVDREGPIALSGDDSGRQGIKESATPVPWTEIRNIRFEVFRPLDPASE